MVKLQQIMCSVEREREREGSKSSYLLPEPLLNNLVVADRGNGSSFGSFLFLVPTFLLYLSFCVCVICCFCSLLVCVWFMTLGSID
jgi:VIT1/CCC1 family predicted Fe2+/Mn2+ transporter